MGRHRSSTEAFDHFQLRRLGVRRANRLDGGRRATRINRRGCVCYSHLASCALINTGQLGSDDLDVATVSRHPVMTFLSVRSWAVMG